MPVRRSHRRRPPLPRGVRWLLLRRRMQRVFHPSAHHRIEHAETLAARPQRLDAVDAARARAQIIERQAIEWAEHLISSAQQRANDIVAAAEERAQEVQERSTVLTRGYLRDMLQALDAAPAAVEPAPRTADRPHLGVVRDLPTADGTGSTG